MHLVVCDEGAMHALRETRAGRQIQHVTLAQQRFSAHLVENGARIDARRYLERDACRYIGLDQSGNHVHRRPLRGQNQMNARGARFLRQACNQLLDLLANHHHQIGKLVYHHHDQRHFM